MASRLALIIFLYSIQLVPETIAACNFTKSSTLEHQLYGRSPQSGTARPPSGIANQGEPPTANAQPSLKGNGPRPKANGKAAPFGFGSKVTGGGNAAPQTPRDINELQTWLTDKIPRVILLSKTYDFTTAAADISAPGCAPWKPCSNGMKVPTARNASQLLAPSHPVPQRLISCCSILGDWCTRESKLPSNIKVTFNSAGINPIKVASHKTLLGVGARGIIKGKGQIRFKISSFRFNVHITWLNPQVVWGGDALSLWGAKNIWIDHCTFSHIGRHMLVTGGKTDADGNTGVTISNNMFSGTTQWSPGCNKWVHSHWSSKHYWNALLTGANDEITMARKLTKPQILPSCIDSTSGRSPKVGGLASSKVVLHYYNNLHTNIIGGVLSAGKGSDVLMEGNVFKNVKQQNKADLKTQEGGRSYVPFKREDSNRCTATLGRPCAANLLLESAQYNWGLVAQTLTTFKARSGIIQAVPVPAASIQNGVPGSCGVGHV
ncbi:hypothetical protein VP01_65g5 [Puccinia sorghi]|uniref:pectin lyase n=1 Tax=Puccinia sorghi TaxID=27349 RepID=A0A0L6UF64_9BASI|nr:hypothetical protein VP01_65g5 [Puccinia sorghi]